MRQPRPHTIEISGTFYSFQRPASFQKWSEETPEHFLFRIKGACFITHVKMLHDVREPLANFFASDVLAQREKLGPAATATACSSGGRNAFDVGDAVAMFSFTLITMRKPTPHLMRSASLLSSPDGALE
ncbi:MAG: DUF72 domain-containing protein [Chthoniobacterales bacterium]